MAILINMILNKKHKGTGKSVGIILLLLSIGAANLLSQTLAHKRSGFPIIDPAYSIDKKLSQSNIKTHYASWIYGPTELEYWRLQLLRQRKNSAKLMVGYPGILHLPYWTASFCLKLNVQAKLGLIKYRAVVHGKIGLNKKFLAEFNIHDSLHSILHTFASAIKEIQFDIISVNKPPDLLVENWLSVKIYTFTWLQLLAS